MGTPLTPWQRHVADVALEVDDAGEWAYRVVVVTVQRQAGKTTLCGPVALHRALTTPDGRAWLTAQRRQDARDTWADVQRRVARSPLAGLADSRLSNGSEALTFPNGSTFRVFAPSEDALHGKANHLVIVDESWSFHAAQGVALEAAILPTFATTGGQLWMVSTAGTAESTWFRSFVDRGRAAAGRGDTRGPLAYFEWSLPDEHVDEVEAGLDPDATPAARTAAYRRLLAAHPAAPPHGRLRPDALEQAAVSMTPGEFLRAYGNRWVTADTTRALPAALWASRRAAGAWASPAPGTVALAVDVAVDGADAAVLAAWRDPGSHRARVDVVDARPGTAWVLERVLELVDRWKVTAVGVDPGGPAGPVADELTRAGAPVAALSGRELAASAAAFVAAVVDDRLEHAGDPRLDRAVADAGTRRLGDGAWAWARRSSAGTIAPLVAATLAVWTLERAPAPAAAPLVVSRRRRGS